MPIINFLTLTCWSELQVAILSPYLRKKQDTAILIKQAVTMKVIGYIVYPRAFLHFLRLLNLPIICDIMENSFWVSLESQLGTPRIWPGKMNGFGGYYGIAHPINTF